MLEKNLVKPNFGDFHIYTTSNLDNSQGFLGRKKKKKRGTDVCLQDSSVIPCV